MFLPPPTADCTALDAGFPRPTPTLAIMASNPPASITREGPVAALTTVFTPPPGCSTSSAASCFPTLWDQSVVAASHLRYYSPGICPSGYSSACNTYHTSLHGPSPLPSETAAICCKRYVELFLCVASYYPLDAGLRTHPLFSFPQTTTTN